MKPSVSAVKSSLHLRPAVRGVQAPAVADPVGQPARQRRAHRGGQGDPRGAAARRVARRGRVAVIERRVVDAGPDVRAQLRRDGQEVVLEEQRRRDPASARDHLTVVWHRADRRRAPALDLWQRRIAEGELDSEVSGSDARLADVQCLEVLRLEVDARGDVRTGQIVRAGVIEHRVRAQSHVVRRTRPRRPGEARELTAARRICNALNLVIFIVVPFKTG